MLVPLTYRSQEDEDGDDDDEEEEEEDEGMDFDERKAGLTMD